MIKQWLLEHPKCPEKLKLTMQLIYEELLIKPISDIKVHLKLESLLKDDPIMEWAKQQPRSILWQRYAVAAIFSPIFTEAKARLKKLLRWEVIYTDGLTPKELNQRVRLLSKIKYIFENDLTKQDR